MGDEHDFLATMIDPGGARPKHGVGYFDEVDAEAMIEEYEEAAATAGRLMAEVAELRRTIVGMGVMMAALGADRDEWKRRAEAAEAEAMALRLKVSRLESPRATEAEAKAQQARSLAGKTRPPRYDDVFDRGVEWLDSLARGDGPEEEP